MMAADMSLDVLERPVATNPESEVWWDSSPRVYDSRRQATLARARPAKRANGQAQLARLFDPARAVAGEMGFGGVTTNPPLSLQAIQNDPEFWTAHSRHIADPAGGDFVYICPPGFIAQLMQAEDQLPPFDATAIDREPDAALTAKLRQLPYFRQAYDFDGMAPGEFSQFAAFAATATEFAAAIRKTVDFVARAMEGRQTRLA